MSSNVLVLVFDFHPNIYVIAVTSVDEVSCYLQHLAPLMLQYLFWPLHEYTVQPLFNLLSLNFQ
jgi:hypothetical protein